MKYFLAVSVVINLILIAIVGIFAYLFFMHKVGFIQPQTAMQQQVKTATVDVNKTFTLPLTKDATTKPLSLTILSVQKTTKIVVGNKSYTTKNNKAFLVVNTLMLNKGTTQIQASASDYVKLADNKQLIDPLYKALLGTISTNDSYTSGMVFVVDDAQKSFTFSIGDNVNTVTQLPISL